MGAPFRIEFERSGGFAGVSLKTSVDSRAIPPDEVREFDELLGDEDVHRGVTRLADDRGGGSLGPGSVAAGDAHPGTHGGQADRSRPADPPGAAGDQYGLAGHRRCDGHG